MFDKCIANARTITAGPSAKLARLWAWSPGVWIAVAAAGWVGILAAKAHPDATAWRRQMAAAYGAANTFYGPPQMNHDGSQFTYVSTTEARGCALYLYDTHTKQARELAFEEDGLGYWRDDYELLAWPWAPDDSALVYTMKGDLVIQPLDTNKPIAKMTVATNSISQLTWLSPARFVFVESGTNLCEARQQVNGQWQYQYCPVPSYDRITSVAVISTNTIAWLQADLICRLNLDKPMADPTSPATTNTVAQSDEAIRSKATRPDSAPVADRLILCLDASTLQQSDRSPVRRLGDLSPRHNSAIAGPNPPSFNAPGSAGALNGKGTIHFSSRPGISNATSLRTTGTLGIRGASPRSIFAVARREARGQMLISTGKIGTPGEYCGLVDNQRNIYLPSGGGAGAENVYGVLSPSWSMFSVICDGENEAGFVNGILKGTSRFQLNTPDVEVELGLRTPKEGSGVQVQASDGDFAELLVYNRALTSMERQQVENYLTRKWFGVTLLTPQNPLVWFNPGLKSITEMAYSPAAGQFLIRCEDGQKKTLWLCDSNGNGSQVMSAGAVLGVQPAGPDRFAYVTAGAARSQIVVTDVHGGEKSRLSTGGNIRAFTLTATGDRMLFVGIASNEPTFGIWQYDLRTAELQNMVAYSSHPFADAKTVTTYHGHIGTGRSQMNYVIYPPPKVERGKKYPLVISDTLVTDPPRGPMFQGGLAGSGAYVAIVERPVWEMYLNQWATNVWTLYEGLKHDPTFDLQRVYLFAASAETQYMSDLVEKEPGPWRGLIILNPTELPDFSKAPLFQRRPKILISVGEKERQGAHLKRYQQDALRDGVIVNYIIGAGETHRFVGKTAKRERAEAMEHFIFEE